LIAYLNVHYLIFESMVHEYAYKIYEYISKLANYICGRATLQYLCFSKLSRNQAKQDAFHHVFV